MCILLYLAYFIQYYGCESHPYFLHVVVDSSFSLLCSITLGEYISKFIHSTSARHLDSFQFGVMKNVAKNILLLISVGHMYTFPRSRSAGSKIFTLHF